MVEIGEACGRQNTGMTDLLENLLCVWSPAALPIWFAAPLRPEDNLQFCDQYLWEGTGNGPDQPCVLAKTGKTSEIARQTVTTSKTHASLPCRPNPHHCVSLKTESIWKMARNLCRSHCWPSIGIKPEKNLSNLKQTTFCDFVILFSAGLTGILSRKAGF